MADNLCGPSNPLQTFHKHTAVDKTLQQDRLALRQAQAESFRSTPGPNFDTLDAEFEAFQAGHGLETGYPDPRYFSNGAQTHAFAQAQASGPDSSQARMMNWASDFQDSHIKEAQGSTILQSQFHPYAPLQRVASGGWQQDFIHQQAQSPSYQLQHHERSASGWSYGYTGGLMPQYNTVQYPLVQQTQPDRHVEAGLDEAAFQRAFEDATSEMHLSDSQGFQQDTRIGQDLYSGPSPETEGWLGHNRIGSDRILDDAQGHEERTNEHAEADELARTAGQLLENVKGDRSQKFKDSNFLSLMRQLRDKEIRVEGDKLVDTSQPLHPGGQNYPNEGLQGTKSNERERDEDIETAESGTNMDERHQSFEAQTLLRSHGIDPLNLSDAQFASFQQQKPEVQQKSIDVYLANVAKKQPRDGADDVPEKLSSKAAEMIYGYKAEPIIPRWWPAEYQRRRPAAT